MNNKKPAVGAVCLFAIVLLIAANTVEMHDFLSGLLTGISIVVSVVSIIILAKEIKAEKENK